MPSSDRDSKTQNSHTSNALQAPNTQQIKDTDGTLVTTDKLTKSKTAPAPTNGKTNTNDDRPHPSNFTSGAAKKAETLIKLVSTQEEFDSLMTTIKDKYILVWFSAIWCGPCKILAVKFEELAQKYRHKIEILQVDVDDLPDLAVDNEVSTMPSYMIMWNGQKLAHYMGSKQEHIDELVEKYLDEKSG